jgi:SDR family mycofactocin-dependent oxidoreductase
VGALDGQVVFITGGARGQGRSHAVRLAREGANVVLLDICAQIESVPYPLASKDDLTETVRQVEDVGGRAIGIVADVREPAAIEAAVQQTIAEFGRLDIVLANAGIGPMSVHDHDDVWRDVLDVNLTGVRNTLAATTPALIEGGRGGSVVITSSTMGLVGVATTSVSGMAYAASKTGVISLMRIYANLLASHSIRVNTVHPTGIGTDMVMNDAMQEYLASIGTKAGGGNALPVPMIEPIDVSNAIAWLVSDAGRYVTGVTLPIDAGYTNKR